MNAGDQPHSSPPHDDEPGHEVNSDQAAESAGAESPAARPEEALANSGEVPENGNEESSATPKPEVAEPEVAEPEVAEPVSAAPSGPSPNSAAAKSAASAAAAAAEAEEERMEWYILKVQSNRENSICDGLRRRVAVAGLDEYFGEVLVPTEDVAEYKNGKRRVVKRKLYPGYIVVHMVINDETWFLVRETPGIGDFTGAAGKPTPMLSHEVERIVKSARPDEESAEPIKTAIPFKVSDRVRIKEGTFENFEGDVEVIDEANGRVTVMINIFGRSTPVELEHWQVESV